ncbi:5'-nucleotidase domain-containing protein 3-like [Styela clava]
MSTSFCLRPLIGRLKGRSICPRFFSQESCSNQEFMQNRYNELRALIFDDHQQICNVNPRGLFAINQINLGEIKVYGFDYDYTLAHYSDDMQTFIYDRATEILHKQFHFPKELLNYKYVPGFCIRGLHYDIQRSLLMKIDACHVIQLGSVYRGLKQLSEDEVLSLFKGSRHIPKRIMDESLFGGNSLRQLLDIFSMPEMMLLTNVVEYFVQNNITYDPQILFESVQAAVKQVHVGGHLFQEVYGNVDKYLKKNSLTHLIDHLTSNGRKLFLITNSNLQFVNVGMKHLIGKDWRDAFDVIIVEAKKPGFFQNYKRPFKKIIESSRNGNNGDNNHTVSWERVHEFTKGNVYYGGCIQDLMQISGWSGHEVIYFGDQIYTDLTDPTFTYGWRTGAVIPELEDEIGIMNSKEFGRSVIWVQTLEKLLERMQLYRDAESRMLLRDWLNERNNFKKHIKVIFNKRFGSVFRSNLQASYFSSRMCRIADIYTSSVCNLAYYNTDHFFFPFRGTLPHEIVVSLAYLHDGFDLAIERAIQNRNP